MLIQANSMHIPVAPESVQCCVTSPPYWGLRDYGLNGGGIGLETTPEEYVERMVLVFRQVWQIIKPHGTLWLNLGDSYAGGGRGGNRPDSFYWKQRTNAGSLVSPSPIPDGLKRKNLIGIPWRVAFALHTDGWYLRSDIIWHKPNPMPENVSDRPTRAHEYLFLFANSERYYYDGEAIREPFQTDPKERYPDRARITGRGNQEYPGNHQNSSGGYPPIANGRNRRSVWRIPTKPYTEAHFATFPEELVRPCILAGSGLGDIVLDPFVGSGTTVKIAEELGRRGIGIDLKWEYLKLAQKRTQQKCISWIT